MKWNLALGGLAASWGFIAVLAASVELGAEALAFWRLALAAATLELVPRDRWPNVPQATLVTAADPVEALLRHRALHGSASLEDLAPDTVAGVALAMLRDGGAMREHMLGPAAGVGEGTIPERHRERRYEPPEDASGRGRRLWPGRR